MNVEHFETFPWYNVSWNAGYARITSTKSPSFYTTAFSARLTRLTVLPRLQLPRKQTNTGTSTTHTTLRTLTTCHIGLDLLTLLASEAGDVVGLILLETRIPSSRRMQVNLYVKTPVTADVPREAVKFTVCSTGAMYSVIIHSALVTRGKM